MLGIERAIEVGSVVLRLVNVGVSRRGVLKLRKSARGMR